MSALSTLLHLTVHHDAVDGMCTRREIGGTGSTASIGSVLTVIAAALQQCGMKLLDQVGMAKMIELSAITSALNALRC